MSVPLRPSHCWERWAFCFERFAPERISGHGQAEHERRGLEDFLGYPRSCRALTRLTVQATFYFAEVALAFHPVTVELIESI